LGGGTCSSLGIFNELVGPSGEDQQTGEGEQSWLAKTGGGKTAGLLCGCGMQAAEGFLVKASRCRERRRKGAFGERVSERAEDPARRCRSGGGEGAGRVGKVSSSAC